LGIEKFDEKHIPNIFPLVIFIFLRYLWEYESLICACFVLWAKL